jgi:transcriptional regulator with XRE-family HTH domain
MAIWNERIHERRIEKGITLAQIAEKLGVTEATAQRYERGNIKSIPYEYMCAYGEILNCSPCYLMGWEEKEYAKKESPKIMEFYEKLNDIGKHEAEKRVEELTHLQKYTKEGENKNNTVEFSEELTPDKDYLLPNAAHADESLTEITEEMIQAEEDIMDNL